MEGFEQEGRVLFSGRNVIKAMTLDGREVVVKRFRRPGLFQKVIYTFFRKTKAYKAYHNALTLRGLGFCTPEPIRYEETRRAGLIDYCYFVSGHDDNPPLEDLTDRDDWNKELALSFARFVADLHDKGVIHRDLNDTNVRFERRECAYGDYAFSLIDINRMDFHDEGGAVPLAECLDNLTRFTGRMDLFEFVVREYAKVRGLDVEATARKALSIKIVHDRNWRRRKRLTSALKRLFSAGGTD
ncbi:MAG: LPS kinase Kdo/WaaP [Bacteroidaceae bacterium]|nr:LPS kinase Kdo/WaaP [Bacteroidaceae bacterium]